MVRVIGHKMARPDSPYALLENLAIGSASESSPLYGHKIWDLSEATSWRTGDAFASAK